MILVQVKLLELLIRCAVKDNFINYFLMTIQLMVMVGEK